MHRWTKVRCIVSNSAIDFKSDTAVDTIVSTAVSLFYRRKRCGRRVFSVIALHFLHRFYIEYQNRKERPVAALFCLRIYLYREKGISSSVMRPAGSIAPSERVKAKVFLAVAGVISHAALWPTISAAYVPVVLPGCR